ncbi:MAG: hypothetical protein EOO92_24095 [Pedobacter sp.]|nr:MAG: hypothetical protein EOO92_24095 [Pedobacter sp.]
MANIEIYERLYNALLEDGGDKRLARIGIYKPLVVYTEYSNGAPYLMMKAHWRPTLNSVYITDFVVEVQLVSLIENARGARRDKLSASGLFCKEVIVHKTLYEPSKRKFDIRFELRSYELNLTEINLMLKYGNPIMVDKVVESYSRQFWFK